MIQIRYDTDDIVVTIPKDLASADYVQSFVERLRVDAILSQSAATDAQIRDLAEEIDAAWWARNRERFLGQASPDCERSPAIASKCRTTKAAIAEGNSPGGHWARRAAAS